jgi:hypothetical protein
MWYMQANRQVDVGFWWQNLQERGHLEDMSIDGIRTLYRIPLPIGNVCVSHTLFPDGNRFIL